MCSSDPAVYGMNANVLMIATLGSILVFLFGELTPLIFAWPQNPLSSFKSGDVGADILAWVFLVFGATTGVLLMFLDAPYGGQYASSWGWAMPAKWGWCFMEAPAAAVFAYKFWEGSDAFLTKGNFSLLPLALFIMWEAHYAYRAFVFPFRQSGKDKPMSLVVVLCAFFWTATNGWLNGVHLFSLGNYPSLSTPWEQLRTVLGVCLFWTGMAINHHSDAILRKLRKPGETAYKIPVGGMFEYVTKANYYGEIVEWAGFGIACCNLAGFLFFLNTIANLVPRALREHRRFHKRFDDYPRSRRAVFPLLL